MLDRRFRIACAAALAALLLALSSPARADDDAFTISGVHEDVTAASALAAKDRAQADGQAKAFAQLMDRLAPGKAPHLTSAQITDLVIGFEVANERSSTVRYTADYTFHFNPAATRRMLEANGITAVTAPPVQEKPVVVLPVFVDSSGRAQLWDDPNPWRDAWAQHGGDQTALPVVVPVGDLPDVTAIDAPKAVAGDRAALKAISARYQNDDVLVVQGKFGPEPGRFDITATRYSIDNPGPPQTAALTTTAKPGETQAQQLARSVASVEAEIGQAWKQANTVDANAGGTINVTLPAGSLADWVTVRNRLRAIPNVRGADLVAFDRSQLRVAIRYAGTQDQLRAALGERGLDLGGADPDWTLTLRAGAAPTPPTAPSEPVAAKPAAPPAPDAAKPDADDDDDPLRKADE